jgi:hypothetical protein
MLDHGGLEVTNFDCGRAFYKAALAGARDHRVMQPMPTAAGFGGEVGAPGLRPHYHAASYGAFVLDPDGNNVEAICHRG